MIKMSEPRNSILNPNKTLRNPIFGNIGILILYSILLFTGITYHEMWMDESHHWLVARESGSLQELMHNYRYDGHPPLWLLIMYCCAFFSDDPMGMQYVHGLITLSGVALLLFKAPLPRILLIAIVFSYFPLYEYGVLSRNYGLLMLLAFCLPVAWQKDNEVPWLPWLILGLIANAHLFGLIFSVAFTSVYLVKKCFLDSDANRMSKLGLLIYALLCCFSAYFIIPPSDHPSSGISLSSVNFSNLADTLMLFFKAIVPIPDFTSDFFWNTNLLTSHLKIWVAPIALISWGLPILFRWHHRWLILVWYLTAFLIGVFYFVTTLNSGLRYGGILVILLIALKWVDNLGISTDDVVRTSSARMKFTKVILTSLLVIQVLSGLYHVYMDVKLPFSSTKNISTYIEEQGLGDIPVVSNAFCNCISYQNYTSKPLYFLNAEESMSFCKWKFLEKVRGRSQQYDLQKSLTKATDYLKESNLRQVILLYNGDDIFTDDSTEEKLSPNVQHLETFNHGIVKRENYAVYLVKQ